MERVEQAISIITTEVKESRLLLAANNSTIANLETQISLEQENSSSFSRTYESAKSELSALKSANLSLDRAIASQAQTIALLQSERDKAQKSAAKWKKRAISIAVILALQVLTKL